MHRSFIEVYTSIYRWTLVTGSIYDMFTSCILPPFHIKKIKLLNNNKFQISMYVYVRIMAVVRTDTLNIGPFLIVWFNLNLRFR